MANGLATVCCKEKPNPTTKSAVIINGNECAFAAGIKIKDPAADIKRPRIRPFLYPILFKTSYFKIFDIAKYNNVPTV